MGVASVLGKFPISSAALGLAGLSVAEPVAKALNPFDDPLQDAVKAEVRTRESNRSLMLKAERMRRNMAMNTARLASLSPHLYNEILAGRRLPKGSVVFGGTPRTDLMEMMSLKMSNGEIGPPPDDQPL